MKVLSAFKKILHRTAIFFSNIFIFLISCFIPKSNSMVLIGGWFGERFCDNSKALFLLLTKDRRFKRVIWISKSKTIVHVLRGEGYQAFYYLSLASIWFHFRCKTHIVDQNENDICPLLSVRCRRINLFHGLPIKKVGIFASKNASKSYLFFTKIAIFSPGFWRNCYYLAPSEYTASLFTSSFLLRKDHTIRASYPRDWSVLHHTEDLGHVPFPVNKKIIFYLPTFRSTDCSFDFDEFFNELSSFCEKNDCVLVYKGHFASKRRNPSVGYKNIYFLPADFDITPVLSLGRLLITDYSSVCWDFMLLHRPVIFFPFDYQIYSENDRGFYRDYANSIPGDIVYTTPSLLTLLHAVLANSSNYFERNEAKYEKELLYMDETAGAFSIDNLVSFILTGKK